MARLFAEIMKENGILSKGELYEVGRADIVGKYVGHTAPLVKSAFKPDFGNGRYVRNIIEKARMAQAERLVENYSEQLTDKEICTLTAEDIEIPENLNTSKVLKIGFAS